MITCFFPFFLRCILKKVKVVKVFWLNPAGNSRSTDDHGAVCSSLPQSWPEPNVEVTSDKTLKPNFKGINEVIVIITIIIIKTKLWVAV